MKRYSIFHTPVLSFFSKAFYRDVALQWRGTGFGYLLLLLIVCWIPTMIQMQAGFSAFVRDTAPKMIAAVPTLTIHNGKASIDKAQPYYIKEPDTGNVLAIIDTTGKIRTLKGTTAKALVTQTEVVFEKNQVETQSYSFHDIKDFKLGPADVRRWLDVVSRWAVPVLSLVLLVGSYVFRMLQALLYALIGLVFAAIFQARLPYAALLRLSVAAVTPCIIVSTILDATGVRLPMALLWYFGAAMAYLGYGVRAASEADSAPPITATPADGASSGDPQWT